jgi:membrane protease YdiL (CAAX protease family)
MAKMGGALDGDSTFAHTVQRAMGHVDPCDPPRVESIGANESPPSSTSDKAETGDESNAPASDFASGSELRPERAWRMWVQVALVVAITLPYYSAFDLLLAGKLAARLPYTFAGDWTYMILHDCFLAACLLGVVWWSGEAWPAFGMKRPQWSVEIVTGFLAYVCALAAVVIGQDLLIGLLTDLHGKPYHDVFPRYWDQSPEGFAGLAALLALAIATGVTEELAMRGILMTRLERLSRSNVLSVLVSAAYFGVYHMSGGIIHVWTTFLVGLVYGVFFAWTGRLWPLIIAHAYFDFEVFLRIGR